jgi:NADH-quinone oxidoreductase subunit C
MLNNLYLKINQIFPNKIKRIIFFNNHLIFSLKNLEIYNFINFLKKYFLFKYLSLNDIWAVDYLEKKKRFEITYSFINYKFNNRIFLKIYLSEQNYIKSISNIFQAANWLEREIYDLFGIYFLNHKNLKRILNDYNFLGFPLRKDFPLIGFLHIKYNNKSKTINENFLKLNQEFRKFWLTMPWISISSITQYLYNLNIND